MPPPRQKSARVLGVDAIIIGTITQFGRDDQHTNIGGGGYGGPLRIGGIGNEKSKAVVGITARVVNITTGEILASVKEKANRRGRRTSLIGAGGGWAAAVAAGLDMGSSNFAKTILGEATHRAVDD